MNNYVDLNEPHIRRVEHNYTCIQFGWLATQRNPHFEFKK
jgi:hypothetical protein